MENLTSDSWRIYSSEVAHTLNSIDPGRVRQFVSEIDSAIDREATIWVFGNGGSAATASHFCVDLSKGAALRNFKAIRAISLMDLTPIQTAWSNDVAYSEAMAMSLKHQARPGDLVIVITGSGNSQNIVNLAKMAHQLKLRIVGMTGFDGGMIRELLNIEIHVPSNDMQIVEDCHHTICHFVSKVI
jgi:D-sedoheptulose 7-phosphate isomerase